MFRRPTKKQQLIKRIITYTVMILSVLVIVSGTILFILGYRLDSDKVQLEQGALVQFESNPGGATVSVDGEPIGARTPSKQTVIAGMHSFMVTRAGYEAWLKTLDVKAGTLEWLDYVRLVPKNLIVESVAKYDMVYGEKASPDNKWLILQEKADTPLFHVVDLRSQDIKTSTVTIPDTIYSDATTAGVTHNFTMERWDDDGRYVIVKHTFNDSSEYIVLDTRDPATSMNISTLLGISLSQVRFSGTSGNILYGLTNGIIRKIDLSSATISRALVTNVNRFDLFATNVITYTGTDPADATRQVAGVYREGDDSAHILRVVKDLTTPLTIAATKYYSDDFVAISEGTEVTILKGRYPSSGDTDNSSLREYARFTMSGAIDTTSFSKNGDRLVVQSGARFASYEIEYMRRTNATVTTSETVSRPLAWLDNAHLWAVYDGHLSMRDFDGSNKHTIMAVESGFDATLSQNGRYIYGIGKSDGGHVLQRVTMLLN